MHSSLRVFLTIAALCLAACSDNATNPGAPAVPEAGAGDGDGGNDAGPPPPPVHRAAAVVCPVSPPLSPNPASWLPDAGPVSPDQTCATDADCGNNDGWAGHCVSYAGAATKECNYDACRADGDCGDSGVCSCQGDTRGYAAASPGNTCVPSNCRVDGDCGPAGLCSPTVNPDCGSFYGTQGWYCHTKVDECTVDADCLAKGASFCAFRPEVGHWTCGTGGCAG